MYIYGNMKGIGYMLKNNIKEILKNECRKNTYITSKMNMTEAHLSNIINGKCEPKISTAIKISKILGVPLEELFYFEDEEFDHRDK